MSYYASQKRAFLELREIIDKSRQDKRNISIPAIIIKLTEKHEISEKNLRKRIDLIKTTYEDMEVNNEAITWLQ